MSIPRITVVGGYATGLTLKVKRLPCTGETILASGYRVHYGGKGSNQAVGCVRLGAEVAFVAKIGEDAFGEMALGLYREEGIDVAFVHQTAERPTGMCFILVEAETGNNCMVLDPGANELLSPFDVAQCDAALKTSAMLLTQLEIPVAAAVAALFRARENGPLQFCIPRLSGHCLLPFCSWWTCSLQTKPLPK